MRTHPVVSAVGVPTPSPTNTVAGVVTPTTDFSVMSTSPALFTVKLCDLVAPTSSVSENVSMVSGVAVGVGSVELSAEPPHAVASAPTQRDAASRPFMGCLPETGERQAAASQSHCTS